VQTDPACGLTLRLIASFAVKFWSATAGVANRADEWKIFKSIISSGGANWAMTLSRI